MFNASITIITIITMLTMGGSQHTTPPSPSLPQPHTHTQNFKPKKVLKRSIINAFPSVVLIASNSVLGHLERFNF